MDVEFDASLALKIDDANTDFGPPFGHYDSPPACCQYAARGGNLTCPNLDPADLSSFLKSPSPNDDLYCCGSDPAVDTDVDVAALGKTLPDNVHSLYCDAENRHNGDPELAVARWRAHDGKKIKMRFVIGPGGGSCRATMNTDEFPEFHLENSALDAALIIDAGKRYQEFPPRPSRRLNEPEVSGECHVETGADGKVQVRILGLPLRFLVQTFVNRTQCLKGISGSPPCPDAFRRRLNGESESSFQILPGFGTAASPISPLSLTTEAAPDRQPIVSELQRLPLTISGSPLKFDAADGKSHMTLVAAFSLQSLDLGSSRNDELGTGPLQAQLGNALLAAQITGTVQRTDGGGLQTLADLTGCQDREGPPPPPPPPPPPSDKLLLTMSADFDPENPDNPEQEIAVVGNPDAPARGFTSETSWPAENLPFAKDETDIANPPSAAIAGHFSRPATVFINVDSSSTMDLPLSIPETAGPFRVLNAASYQNIVLAKGNRHQIRLDLEFDPATTADGCNVSEGETLIHCEKELRISSVPSMTVTLRGQAKRPAPEMVMEEIQPVTVEGVNASIGRVLPSAAPPTVAFGEALVGIQTKTKLFKIANNGVRDLAVVNLRTLDSQRNFRLGSVYQGPDFSRRRWVLGQNRENPWTIPPTGSEDLFFFLNYGPFGRVGGCGGDTKLRCDSGALSLTTRELGTFVLPLSGSARNDTRAVLGLFIQDSNRASAAPSERPLSPDPRNPLNRVFLVQGQEFSFRQDPAPRDVYLKNTGPTGVDSLKITGITPPAGTGFTWTFADGIAAALAPEAGGISLQGGESAKIGTISLNPAGPGESYAVVTSPLVIHAVSRDVRGAVTNPIIGGFFNEDGSVDRSRSEAAVSFSLKGTKGAPNRTGDNLLDLRIHRLFAGLSVPFANSSSLMISTTTRGMLGRFDPGLANPDDFVEVFTIPNVFELDAVRGTARLRPIFTEVDPGQLVNPTIRPRQVSGVRLFNGPGSSASGPKDFLIQCERAATHECVFFNLYLGGWDSTARRCPNGKPVINASPELSAAQVADPRIPDDAACMRGQLTDLVGSYDPLTGEVIFPQAAVRLYAPINPLLSSNPIDTTLHVGLTTGCVGDNLIFGLSADDRLVPQEALNFARPPFLEEGRNPLNNYTGGGCGAGRLHGRPMLSGGTNGVDPTGTFDIGPGLELDPAAFDFDIAGAGKTISGLTQADGKTMYIVIKAEVGDF